MPCYCYTIKTNSEQFPSTAFLYRGSASGCQGFRRNRPKLPGGNSQPVPSSFINCFDLLLPLCYGPLCYRIPLATQTFAEGSAAAKWLKNAAPASFAICLCRERSGYERTAISSLHDNRTVNLM